MSLKKIISICLIAYVAITLLIVVFGLWIAPQRVVQTIPNPTLQLSSTTPAGGTSTTQENRSTGNQQSTTAEQSTKTTTTTTAPTSTPTPSVQPSPTPTPAPAPTPTPAPAPAPTPAPAPIACGSAGGTCTAAQVATHNTQTNCWMIYNNKYYVVTSYVSLHPGGRSLFNSTSCGHDVTAYLNGGASLGGQRHTHSSSAYTTLSSYYVGPVSG